MDRLSPCGQDWVAVAVAEVLSKVETARDGTALFVNEYGRSPRPSPAWVAAFWRGRELQVGWVGDRGGCECIEWLALTLGPALSCRCPRFRGSNGSRSNNLSLIISAYGSGRGWSHLTPVVGQRQQNMLCEGLIIGQPRLPTPRPLDQDQTAGRDLYLSPAIFERVTEGVGECLPLRLER
jgi:hypothetical protein